MICKQRSPDIGNDLLRAEPKGNVDDDPMSERKKMRFMKFMVITCIVTLICMFIAAYIGYWNGVDMDMWLTLGCGAFSLELAATTVIKIYQKDGTKTKTGMTGKKAGINKVNG